MSHGALTDDCRALVESTAEREQPVFATLDAAGSVAYTRELRSRFPVAAGAPDPDVEIRDGSADGVPVRIYRERDPEDGRRGTIVLLHGGGWVAGTAAAYDVLGVALCHVTAGTVVSVDYRLAPEHRYPAALDDAYRATLWTQRRPPELGDGTGPVQLLGVSAGGNLAAAVTLRARDDGRAPVDGQILVYPVLDAAMSSGSHGRNARGYVTTSEQIAWFWRQYVPEPATRSDPYASPLAAASFADLPRALVVAAEFDPLCDEALAYAEALRRDGTPATVQHCQGQIHGFLSLFPEGAASLAVLAAVSRWSADAGG